MDLLSVGIVGRKEVWTVKKVLRKVVLRSQQCIVSVESVRSPGEV